MSEKGMTELKLDHLEIAARTWAAEKAREIAGIVVDNVLNQASATIPDLDLIQHAESHTARFLGAWLKNSVIEFTRVYMRDVEERALQVEKLIDDVANTTPNPPFIKSGERL